MIIVIIAGGSGTRLWPLSTPSYPKHLLTVNGDAKSLLQNTYKRAKQLTDTIYVVSETSHIKHVKDQLPDLPDGNFIVEPARRGTASCILAALVHISAKHGSNVPIAFSPADHYVRDEDGFVHSFKEAAETSIKQGRIVLIGVEPDFPATGFGYIQKDKLLEKGSYAYEVKSFKEKPDYNTARSYVRSGNYLWNCGYFVGSINTFKEAMKKYSPEILLSYQKLEKASNKQFNETYLKLENISIDYALIEKVQNLLVIPASFDWRDLGSFSDLHKAVDSNEAGNHIHGNVEIEEVENSFIQNHEEKPVAVIGLDNVVIVNTPGGILVARKDMAQQIGDISKRIHNKS